MPSTTSCQAWEAMKREVFLVTNQATAGTQRGANIPATWIAAAILRSCWVVSGPLGWSGMRCNFGRLLRVRGCVDQSIDLIPPP